MAWTAPITFVDGTALTASQLNTYLRDNLLETSPAKAANVGGYFITTGTNVITERVIGRVQVDTLENTTSTSYTALTTPEVVTVTTGTSALVLLTAQMSANGSNSTWKSFTVSGASSIAASDPNALLTSSDITARSFAATRVVTLTNLTAGSNTFTAQYKVNTAGTLSALNRSLVVIPLS